MLLGYARVSTFEQAEGNRSSLAEQQRIIQSVAMARGMSQYDISIYTDAGVSGAVRLSKRPEGGKLFMDAKRGDIVCAAKLDRLFRDTLDAAYIYDNFKERGIDLILFDLGTESVMKGGTMAKAMFGVVSIFADMERDRIAERLMGGKRAKLAKGGHIGGKTPFGWRKIGEGREARLEPVPHEQEVIAAARVLRSEIVGEEDIDYPQFYNQAARKLTKQGLASRTGKPFKANQVQRMLENMHAAH